MGVCVLCVSRVNPNENSKTKHATFLKKANKKKNNCIFPFYYL